MKGNEHIDRTQTLQPAATTAEAVLPAAEDQSMSVRNGYEAARAALIGGEEHARLQWDEDGICHDLDTGEIVDVQRGFEISTMARLEWALGRIAREEAEIIALEARRRALLENIESMVADHNRRLVGFHNRFDAEIETFARSLLDGARTKTLKTPQGSVSFRISPPSHTIADMAAAVAWAEEHKPDVVRKLVTLSELGPVYHEADNGAVEMTAAPFVEAKGGGERMYIRTNVGRR